MLKESCGPLALAGTLEELPLLEKLFLLRRVIHNILALATIGPSSVRHFDGLVLELLLEIDTRLGLAEVGVDLLVVLGLLDLLAFSFLAEFQLDVFRLDHLGLFEIAG